MLPTVAKPDKREKSVADHQQRLLKSDKQLSMHGDQLTDVEQERTCSASIKTCLNLPAERKEEEGVSALGVGRGGEYETPNSTRGNQGNVPIARGFVTVVLRQLSIDSLARSSVHWRRLQVLPLERRPSPTWVSWLAQLLGSPGYGSYQSRPEEGALDPRSCQGS